MSNKVFFGGALTLASGVLSGCSVAPMDEALSNHSEHISEAESIIKSHSSLSRDSVSVSFVDDDYIVGSKFNVETRGSLPSFFREMHSFNRMDPMTFSELVSYINRVTNVRMEISHDAAEYLKRISSDADEAESIDFEEDDENMDFSISLPSLMSDHQSGLVGSEIMFTVDFEGSLEDFMNHILGRLNLSWDWRGNYIEIYHTVEKTFILDSDLAEISFSSEMEGGAGSTHSFGMNNEMGSLYDEIESVLANSISESGKFSVSRQLSTVTVVDTPSNLKRIERFIKTINENASKQIMLRVQVMDIESNNSGDYGVDWDAIFGGSSRIGASAATSFLSEGGEMFSMSVLDGNLAGTAVGLRSLAEKTNVSTSINTNVHTSNGRPVPLKVGAETSYIATIEVDHPDDGSDRSPTISPTPGEMTTGFMLNILPRINSSGDVSMTLGLDISEGVIDERTFPDGTMIGLPDIFSRSFIQRAVAGNGSPVMLAGFERTRSESTDSRIGSKVSWLLGGRQQSSNRKVMTVILITPYIMK